MHTKLAIPMLAAVLMAGLHAVPASAKHKGWLGSNPSHITNFTLKRGDRNNDGLIDKAESELLAGRMYRSITSHVGEDTVDRETFIQTMVERRMEKYEKGRKWRAKNRGKKGKKCHGKRCPYKQDPQAMMERVQERMERLFIRLDSDGNGIIEKTDIMRTNDRYFADADSNGDDVLDRDEIRAFHLQRRVARREEKRSHRFDRMDTNQDGLLSREEYLAR